MKTRVLILVGSLAFAGFALAEDKNKDCDECRRIASAAKFSCLQKAKTGAEKEACNDDAKQKEQLCKLVKCRKGLF
jgi:hypothetical protein